MSSLKLVLFLTILLLATSRKDIRKSECHHDKHILELTFADIPVANANTKDKSNAAKAGIEDLLGNKGEKNSRNLQQTYPNLKVYPIYDTLTTGDAAFQNYVKTELVPSVITYLQKLLKVKNPVIGNFSLPSYYTSVCGVTTPKSLFAPGVPADLTILVTAFTDNQTSTIAWASPCVLDTTVSRPVVGMISFNTAAVVNPNGDPLVHENNIQTTLHEITHVLGFSSGLFNYFRDANGNKRTGHILTRTINGVSSTVLNVEPLTSKLRAYFGCTTLEGAVMENQGGSGSAGTHFERRIFGYEYMTASIVPDMRISEFSLALLEGSGWYVPDYTMSEPTNWGRGQGCPFVTGTCTANGKPKFDEFCQTGNFGCSATGRVAVTCSGYDTFADGCSWYVPYSYNDCEDPDSVDYAALPSQEVYGAGTGSRCFTGNLYKGYSSSGTYGYCFKFTCSGSGVSTVLNVQIGTTTAVCKTAGSIPVTGLTGKLNCPDPVKYCSTIGKGFCRRGCMGNGSCVNGKCQCSSGWTGLDCGIKQ